MSQRTYEQKQLLTQLFARKTKRKAKTTMEDAQAVTRRRRIEELEEQKRFDLEYSF